MIKCPNCQIDCEKNVVLYESCSLGLNEKKLCRQEKSTRYSCFFALFIGGFGLFSLFENSGIRGEWRLVEDGESEG